MQIEKNNCPLNGFVTINIHEYAYGSEIKNMSLSSETTHGGCLVILGNSVCVLEYNKHIEHYGNIQPIGWNTIFVFKNIDGFFVIDKETISIKPSGCLKIELKHINETLKISGENFDKKSAFDFLAKIARKAIHIRNKFPLFPQFNDFNSLYLSNKYHSSQTKCFDLTKKAIQSWF